MVKSISHRKIRNYDVTTAPIWFRILNAIILLLMAILFLLPFWLVATASFMPEEDIMTKGFTLWPSRFTTSAYEYLFTSSDQFINAFKVTGLLTVIGTANTLFWTSMGAYVLSRRYLPYRNGLTLFVFITMLFNGGLIPWYLVVKSLGMVIRFLPYLYPLL